MSTAQAIAHTQRLVGRILADKFRLNACIGIGGTGAVYRAEQIALGRTVAVKVLNEDLAADPRLVNRFRDEAMAASRLNHGNIVSIIDYGQATDGLLYLAMEHLRGPTLTQLITREGGIPVSRVINLVLQILAGIEEAHYAGIVHADLKSDNIIVEQRREGHDVVKLVDFGIARLVHQPSGEGEERNICGTPEYMAPEVITGSPPGFPADLYAVAVIMYELLTGETPFLATSTVEVLTGHLRTEHVPVATRRQGVSGIAEIDTFLRRGLAKQPEHRFSTAEDMREALLEVQKRLLAQVPAADVVCAGCGITGRADAKFCAECGQPRAPLNRTITFQPTDSRLRRAAETLVPLPLVGRARDVQSIAAHLRGDRAARTLLVEGLPGVGRTRVVEEAAAQVAREQAVTLFQVGADPTGITATYYPMRSLLASMLNLPPVCGAEELRRALIGLGVGEENFPGVAQLFGQDAPIDLLEEPLRRREALLAIVGIITGYARSHKIAIIFDDVDRYDASSLEVVRRLVDFEDDLAQGAAPMVLIATTEHAALWSIDLPRLALSELGHDAITTIVARVAAVEPPSADELYAHTGGLPAHLNQLIHYHVEGGQLDAQPMQLADLITARLSLLPRPALEMLQALAVLGYEADLPIVLYMLRMPDYRASLEDLVQRGIVTADAHVVRFANQLVREVVYDSTPADARRAWHEAAAEAHEELRPDTAQLGHHYDLAGDAVNAVPNLIAAGQRAQRQLDPDGARRAFARALVPLRQALRTGDDSFGGVATFIATAAKLADALRAVGESALARGVLNEATPWAEQPAHFAILQQSMATVLELEGDLAGAVAHLRRAIGHSIAAGQLDAVCLQYVQLVNVLGRQGQPETARQEIAEAIDLVSLGEGIHAEFAPPSFWRLVLRNGAILVAAGDAARALEYGEAALAQAERVDDLLGRARSQQFAAVACERLGQTARAVEYRRAASANLKRLGDRRGTSDFFLPPGSTVAQPRR